MTFRSTPIRISGIHFSTTSTICRRLISMQMTRHRYGIKIFICSKKVSSKAKGIRMNSWLNSKKWRSTRRCHRIFNTCTLTNQVGSHPFPHTWGSTTTPTHGISHPPRATSWPSTTWLNLSCSRTRRTTLRSTSQIQTRSLTWLTTRRRYSAPRRRRLKRSSTWVLVKHRRTMSITFIGSRRIDKAVEVKVNKIKKRVR